jgi:hypothetical protein
MNNRITEDVQRISLIAHKSREHYGVISGLDRLIADRATHSWNKIAADLSAEADDFATFDHIGMSLPQASSMRPHQQQTGQPPRAVGMCMADDSGHLSLCEGDSTGATRHPPVARRIQRVFISSREGQRFRFIQNPACRARRQSFDYRNGQHLATHPACYTDSTLWGR